MEQVIRPIRRHNSLDGLRGIAVLLVIFYHAEAPGFHGIWVSIDVFFALSGYLITTLMIKEVEREGRVDIRQFWYRRARRLWPMAWVTLTLIAAAGLWDAWGADRQELLGEEILFALLHLVNWWQIDHGGYVQSFLPDSPLRHFWTLSVEEQFYLFWPVLMTGIGWVATKIKVPALRIFAILIGVGAVAGVLYARTITPEEAYLNTFARCASILGGAGLAIAWRATPLRGPWNKWTQTIGFLGFGGLFALGATTNPETEWLHLGGYAISSVCSVAAVATVAAGQGWVKQLFSTPALVWLGQRSYAIYLFHWPLLLLYGFNSDWRIRTLVSIVVSILFAAVTFKLIEQPVIQQKFRPRYLLLGTVALLGATLVFTIIARPDTTPSQQVAAGFDEVSDPVIDPPPTSASEVDGASDLEPAVTTTTTTLPLCQPEEIPQFGLSSNLFDFSTVSEVHDPTHDTECSSVRVVVFGDSIARGLSNGLRSAADPRITVWDRSVLGCTLVPGEDCPDYRQTWFPAVQEIQPHVVIISVGIRNGVLGIPDDEVTSAAASELRTAEFIRLIEEMGSTGAQVMIATRAIPRQPEALFYCDQTDFQNQCSAEWSEAWNSDIRAAAEATGAQLLDTQGWVASRGNTEEDRPDGFHMPGPLLIEEAHWNIPQILFAAQAGEASKSG